MRGRICTAMGVIAAVGSLAGAVAANDVAAKPVGKKMKVHCTARAYNEAYPQLSGLALAVLKCSKPFGAGVQKATNSATVAGSTVSVTGVFKNFFDGGTDSGKVKLTGTFAAGAITVSGTVTITSGTGAYRHIRGKGSVKCTTADAGKTFTCTVSGTATR